MKKIDFAKHIMPHLIAIGVFLIVTVTFFSPVFLEDKALDQHDIQQFKASAHAAMEYREQTGEEPLWSKSMFGGMPLYLVNLQWDNQPVSYTKMVLSLGLPHPVCNIYLAFLCYYIMLLAFGIRPYIAIASAIAFGLSTYMILGLSAGHNGRIGAIAFMPLVMAGIHLAFTNRKLLGFGVAAMGMALQLRENHLQITYYLAMIAGLYAIIKLVEAIRQKTIMEYVKGASLLVIAMGIAVGSFFGQFWSITEYTKYSIRGEGLSKDYAFQYKYGIFEPMTLLVPSFYGGGSQSLLTDESSATYQALMGTGSQEAVNKLSPYTGAYWGPQSGTAGPYYAGAVIIFLFLVGILFAEVKYVIWLVPLSLLSIMISWGDSFSGFNYWLFDHLPGYNKFRSFSFALIIILFCMPLLGALGVNRLWSLEYDKNVKRKLLIAGSIVGGLCLLLLAFAGIRDYSKPGIGELPDWLKSALAEDRVNLFRMDAARSLAFILCAFAVLYFQLHKKINVIATSFILIALVAIDLSTANKRYFKDEQFKEVEEVNFVPNLADQAILAQKHSASYRVFNFTEPFGTDARTSYFHHNIGGYHGAKMKRYQEFFDSCFSVQAYKFTAQAQKGNIDLGIFQAANMLNVKYLVFGDKANTVLPNPQANGNAWFVQNVVEVKSPQEELKETGKINTRTTAVIDVSKFKAPKTSTDSTASITLVEEKPNYLKYKASSKTNGLAVFSEIYYPHGWIATINGKEAPILSVDYILRALEVPAGNDNVIEFSFKPKAYYTGNKITQASSWLALLILLAVIAWSLKAEKSSAANAKTGTNPGKEGGQVLDNNIKK